MISNINRRLEHLESTAKGNGERIGFFTWHNPSDDNALAVAKARQAALGGVLFITSYEAPPAAIAPHGRA